MTMPTAKMVNAGRYFTFNAKVEGTKTCYTNTIDRDQYNKDLVEAQVDMMRKYNVYRKWYQLSQEDFSEEKKDYNKSCKCTEEGGICGPECTTASYITTWKVQTIVRNHVFFDDLGDEKTGIVKWHAGPYEESDSQEAEYLKNEQEVECPGGEYDCTRDEDGDKDCDYCEGGKDKYYDKDWKCDEECYRQKLIDAANTAEEQLNDAIEKFEKILEEYAECTKWTTEIEYDPEVYYDYEEDYLNKFGLIGEMDKQSTGPSTSTWTCDSRVTTGTGNETKAELVGKDYDKCKTSSSNGGSTKLNYVFCSTSECKVVPTDVADARYMKVSSEITTTYKPKTLFYNIYPSGEITDTKADDNVELTNKLPVALNRDRGIYKYTVNIENLGEFYDRPTKGNLGRYVGSSTAVVDPNTLVYNCAYLVNIVESNGWVCDFDDNCTDDCISNCVGPNCGEDYCEGADCIHECIGLGCIYDTKAGSSILEKVVSLSKLFPNGTNSYNWNQSRNDKADETVKEIESLGNTIYDEQPILSVTINGSAGAAIRKHNDEAEKNNGGGYSNDSLDCYSLGGNEEIACYSRFITGLMEGEYGNVVNDNSLVNDVRRESDNNTEYFTLWNGTVSDKKMLGPSWK